MCANFRIEILITVIRSILAHSLFKAKKYKFMNIKARDTLMERKCLAYCL